MKSHYELNDHEFESQFSAGQIDPAVFSHEAHLRIAWIYLRKYGEPLAIQKITSSLFAFVNKIGAGEKYHHTITIAAIKMVRHFLDKSEHAGFREFIELNPQLKYRFRELLALHYSTDIFNSPQAREKFLAPDLIPFD